MGKSWFHGLWSRGYRLASVVRLRKTPSSWKHIPIRTANGQFRTDALLLLLLFFVFLFRSLRLFPVFDLADISGNRNRGASAVETLATSADIDDSGTFSRVGGIGLGGFSRVGATGFGGFSRVGAVGFGGFLRVGAAEFKSFLRLGISGTCGKHRWRAAFGTKELAQGS